jgi:hypothetical protein
MTDNINPAHYQRNGGLECIEAIEAMVAGWPPETAYRLGNALKYLWRHREKGGSESLQKAQWYIAREIEELEADNWEFLLSPSNPKCEQKLSREEFEKVRRDMGL